MLVRIISQHAIKRLISALRSAHHGATILLLPVEFADEMGDINRYIDLKYRFATANRAAVSARWWSHHEPRGRVALRQGGHRRLDGIRAEQRRER